ncbi:MAG: cytochrome c family protein [Gammaproteobacteria bacterium]
MHNTSNLPAKLLAFVTVSVALSLSACADGDSSAPSPGAATTEATAAPADFNELLATADPAKGKVQFLQCRACHSLEAAGPNKVGPNLHGLFGKKAGFAPGFNYSDALKNSGVVWSAETLDHWFERPSELIPGNHMVFVGIRNPGDRANLIAYLKQEAGGSSAGNATTVPAN